MRPAGQASVYLKGGLMRPAGQKKKKKKKKKRFAEPWTGAKIVCKYLQIHECLRRGGQGTASKDTSGRAPSRGKKRRLPASPAPSSASSASTTTSPSMTISGSIVLSSTVVDVDDSDDVDDAWPSTSVVDVGLESPTRTSGTDDQLNWDIFLQLSSSGHFRSLPATSGHFSFLSDFFYLFFLIAFLMNSFVSVTTDVINWIEGIQLIQLIHSIFHVFAIFSNNFRWFPLRSSSQCFSKQTKKKNIRKQNHLWKRERRTSFQIEREKRAKKGHGQLATLPNHQPIIVFFLSFWVSLLQQKSIEPTIQSVGPINRQRRAILIQNLKNQKKITFHFFFF